MYRAFLRAPVLEGLTVVMKKREHSIQRHNVWLMSVLMVSALLVVSWSFIELPGLREIAALVSLGGAIALFKRMHWAISDLFRGPQKAIQNIETKSIESSGTPVIELAADTNQSVSVPKPRRKKRSKDS